jgi:hypothetical protein
MLAIRRLFFGIWTSLGNERALPHLIRSVAALATGMALLAGTAAWADDPLVLVLATGGVYGGISQNHDVCYAFNPTKTVTPQLVMIIRDQSGGILGTTTGVVLPGRIIAVATYVANNLPYSCTVFSTTAVTDLRGVMDVRDVNNNVLINSNLR